MNKTDTNHIKEVSIFLMGFGLGGIIGIWIGVFTR